MWYITSNTAVRSSPRFASFLKFAGIFSVEPQKAFKPRLRPSLEIYFHISSLGVSYVS